MSDLIEITDEERVAVWPCDHGNVLIERGGVPANHQCAKCGAKPEFYVPAHLLDTAVEFIQRLIAPGDGLQSSASRLAGWVLEFGEDVPYEVRMAAVEAEGWVRTWTGNRTGPALRTLRKLRAALASLDEQGDA